jgi:hypothetical protein
MSVVSESDVVNGLFENAHLESVHGQQMLASITPSSTPRPVDIYAQCEIERIKQNPPSVSFKQLIQTTCDMCGSLVSARIGDRPADVSVSP